MSSKKGRGQRYAKRHANATCSPDPSNPNLCAAWLEAAWQIPLGFMYATSAAIHIFHLTGWMTWIFFLLSDKGAYPGPFVSSNPHPLPVLRLNQQHLPSLRNPPSTSSRAISACHGRHVSDPSQIYVSHCQKAPPTCSSTPATGVQELLYNKGYPKICGMENHFIGGRDEQKTNRIAMAESSYLPLSWRELSSVFSTANLGKLLRQRQETMAGWDLDLLLPDCSRDSGPLNHLPVLVCCRCSFEIKDFFFRVYAGVYCSQLVTQLLCFHLLLHVLLALQCLGPFCLASHHLCFL